MTSVLKPLLPACLPYFSSPTHSGHHKSPRLWTLHHVSVPGGIFPVSLSVESCQHACCGLPTHCLATVRLRKGHLGNKNPGTPPGELHLARQSKGELLSVQGVPVPWHHDLKTRNQKAPLQKCRCRGEEYRLCGKPVMNIFSSKVA